MSHAPGAPESLTLARVMDMLPFLTASEMAALTAWESNNLGSVGDWPGWAEVVERNDRVGNLLRSCSRGVD